MFRHRTRAPAAAVILSGQTCARRANRGMNHIALALVRSLGRRGVPVFRFHPDAMLHDLDSRYCKHVPCPNLYDDEAALVDALRQFARTVGRAPVLFAASDAAASFLARHEEALAGRYRVSTAPAACIAEIQDKGRLYQRAIQLGLAVPRTFTPADESEVAAAAGAVTYPAVIKPLTSHHWKTTRVAALVGHAKAVEVNSPEALLAVYRRVAPLAPRMMIQEIVPGDDERLLTFLGYFDREGRALAGCVRKKLRQSPPRFGYCCLTETVRDAEAMHAAIRLLSGLGYRGIGCVEFKRDPRDGQLKLIEVNTRAVRTTAVAGRAGIDLPYLAYLDMLGLPVRPCFHYRAGVRWIHLLDEVFAASALMRRGELSLEHWATLLRGPMVDAEWAWDDPLPFVGRTRGVLSRLAVVVARRRIIPPVRRGAVRLTTEMLTRGGQLGAILGRVWAARRKLRPGKQPAAAAALGSIGQQAVAAK
jgi:predicted ATP-grasp superfamily ATP-dependent carboligase